MRVRAEGDAPYRQRVIANVVAAATPLKGGETAHNVTLDYRPDMLNTAIPALTARLLEQRRQPRLPDVLAQELAAYPDWQGGGRPGAARVAPALLQLLDAP